MSELTKNQLKQDNQNSFPNNNTGYITPAILRDFNINMIDSLVDEVSYNADSSSFNARINALDPSGSAASLLALEAATASLNAYTASQNSFNTSATASIVALQSFSSSLDATFATDAQLSASVAALSSSVAVTDNAQSASIAALQSFSSSLDATFATDAQLSASVSSLSSSVAVTDLAQSASIAALQNFSSSLDATFATDAQLSASVAALSSSVAVTDLAQSQSIAALQQFSSSLNNSYVSEAEFGAYSSSINSYTQSNDTKWNNLGNQSGSFITESETGSMSVASASFATTASFALNVTPTDVSPFLSASVFNAYTQSNDSKVNSLINATGSYVTEAESGSFVTSVVAGGTPKEISVTKGNGTTNTITVNNVDSASFATTASFALNSVAIDTGSFATTGSNQFKASQGITGSLSVTTDITASGDVRTTVVRATNGVFGGDVFITTAGDLIFSGGGNNIQNATNITATGTVSASAIFANSASFNYIQTIYETASIIFSSGSNQLGDELSDVQTLSGSVKVQGALTLNGVPVLTSSFDASSYLLTSSFNSYTASASTAVSGAINSATQSLSSSIAVTTNNLDLEVNQKLDSASFNSYTQSNDSKVNALINATSSYITSAQTSSMTVLSSSYAVTASFALNATGVDTGSLVSTSSFNQYTQSAASNVSQSINAATQSLSSSIAVTTNNLDLEVNQKLDSSSFNSYTSSNDSKVNSLIAATASYAISSSVATTTGLSLVTASIAGDTITFTKGNGSTFPIVIPTASGSVPSGTVSSSAQITEFGFATTSSVSESVSALNAATSSYITSAQTASMTVASASFATSASFAVTSSLAQNVVIIARNGNPSTLAAGTIVHITGASGDNPIFNTASFDSETLSANTLGVLRQSAASGADVDVLVNGIVTGVNTDPALGYVAGDIIYLSSSGQFTRVQPQAPQQIVTIGQVLRAQQNNGSIYVNITNGWELNELHNVAINGEVDGDLLVYRSGSGLWTNSSSIELGNATTGSNTFVGKQIVSQSLLVRSGSVYSISNNTTVNPELYYTESQGGQANIIRGWGDDPAASGVGNTQANYTSSVRITGSNNIVSIPQIRATNFGGGTADMTGYISGSNNIINSSLAGIYLNSGSQLFPKTVANTLAVNSSILMNFTTSSLSGGHPTVNNNTIQVGSIALNHPSGALNAIANILLNSTITSSQAFVTNVRPTINTNIANGGTITLRHISGSVTFNANIANGPLSVENHLSSSGIANNGLTVVGNALLGGSSNTGHGIYVSGSQNSNAARTIIDNIIGGKNIIVSSSFVSSSNSSLLASLIYGQNLIVSGNHSVSAGGSTFVGRYNDTGSLAMAQDIVFAVGTGTSTTARKTGLWVDSGSITTINGGLFVSGASTLNVGGNSSFTGSVFTSASVSGVVNGLTISSQTASLDFSKGNFFTLQLVSGSSTHINPTNVAAGQTINVRLNTTGSGTVTFASSVKQASGSAYTPTTATGIDILTMVTFDTTDVYLANVKNLI